MATSDSPAAPKRSGLRVFGATVGVGAVISILLASHYYVAKRFFLDPGWGEPLATSGTVLVMLGFVGFFALPVIERKLPPRWMRALALPTVVWMGVLWLAFSAWVIADLAALLLGLFGVPGPDPVTRAFAIGALVAVASAVALRNGLRIPKVRRQEIRLDRWPAALDGFRIAQISDIHIGPVLDHRFARGLTERVNSLDADLVVVTGDLVDGPVEALREDVEPFAALRARHGVYFITGNHDVYSGDVAWVERVRELGMRPLRNERVAIAGADGFDLAGVDDHRGDWRASSSEDLGAALDGRDPARATVLLAHDPSTFKRARGMDIDLQISGHTHGGQLWPFHGLVRLVMPWVQGLHREGAAQIWVSRGSGFWGPPMRLFAPSEVSELVLRPSLPGATAAQSAH